MVAIQLLYEGYKIIPQQKIGGYHVDFAIPKEKIIIEVDGGRYHDAKDIGGLRDMILKECFGEGTKVMHIPAEYIRKNIKRLGILMKNYKET
jgi:very-short-patch-repair endonuclease